MRIKDFPETDYAEAHHGANSYTWSGVGGRNNNGETRQSFDPTQRMHLDSEHYAGAPAGEAGLVLQGSPAIITQGDILSMIGPALTARGDTFLVRSYGDKVNPLTSEVESRVWLEAVVQRVIDPVTPLSTDPTNPDRFVPTDRFGRRFEIISIRWLNDDEI